MVDVCNPQNYTNIKFLFYILLWFNLVALKKQQTK